MNIIINRLLLLFVSLFLPLFLQAASNPPAQHTIDFTQSDNLKVIFDAGLRPWRLQGLENQCCELNQENLKIILSENARFNLLINSADISVLAGNQLASVDFFGEKTTVPDGARRTKEICQALGIATIGLDKFIHDGGNKGSRIPNLWQADTVARGIKVSIMCSIWPIYQGAPFIEINLTLEWPRENETMRFQTAPIQPPPGYENVSMAPPPIIPLPNGEVMHDADYYKGQIDQYKIGQNLKASGFWWGLWALLAILAVRVVVYVIKKK